MSICCVCGKTEKNLKRAKPKVRLRQTLPAPLLLARSEAPGADASTCICNNCRNENERVIKAAQEAVIEPEVADLGLKRLRPATREVRVYSADLCC